MWLLLAIVTRFLWSCCVLLDQYTARFFSGPGATGAASTLHNLMALPIMLALIAIHGVPAWPPAETLLWIELAAAANSLALIPYLRTMQTDDAHNTTPLFQIIPVIVIVLSWIFYGETMRLHQIAGALLIMLTGFLLLWDFKARRVRFKPVTLCLIFLSALLYALYGFFLRPASLALDPWSVTIYFLAGTFLTGLVMAAAKNSWRQNLLATIGKSRGHVLILSLTNNSIWCVSLVTLSAAMGRAPGAGYVSALGGTQPFFVLGLSWIGGLLPGNDDFRKLSWSEDIRAKLLLLPVLTIGIILLSL